MSSAKAIIELRQALGSSGWLESDSDTAPFRNEWRGYLDGRCVGVARPKTAAEVQAVVRIAAAAGLKITPQGGNTGVTAAGIPPADGETVVLSLARLNRVREVSADGYWMTVDAGVPLQVVQEAAIAADRLFPLDFGARGSALIGGAISTNAGGNNTLRYGNCREQVLGLEVVLADGSLWDGMRALRKDNTGYDLKQLFIGAEGTLGIVTGATLRLQPLPKHSCSAFVALAALDRLPALLQRVRDTAGDLVDAFELCPESLVAATSEQIEGVRRPLDSRADWYVLLRLSAMEPVEEPLMKLLEYGLEQELIVDGVVAQSGAQETMLWKLREHAIPSGLFAGPMVSRDAAVPIERVAPFIAAVNGTLTDWPGAWLYCVGHVGDGNLHLTVLGHRAADAAAIRDRVNALTWQFGGTVSAEHGIGQLYKADLAAQKSAVEMHLMRAVKRALDPDELFNPAVLLP